MRAALSVRLSCLSVLPFAFLLLPSPKGPVHRCTHLGLRPCPLLCTPCVPSKLSPPRFRRKSASACARRGWHGCCGKNACEVLESLASAERVLNIDED